jgi:basic membrane protein A and related proteins
MKRRFVIGLPLLLALVALAVYVVAGASGGVAATKRLKVRVITATPLHSGTWDPAHFAGYSPVAKRMNWNLQIAELVPYGKAADTFNRWGAEGVDIVFSTDNGFEKYLLDAAAKYPKTTWVIMSDLSTTRGLTNVGSYGVDSCQEGFLEGAAAAYLSKKHVIGVDSPIPILPNKKEIAGLKLAVQKAVPGTKVIVQYTGDFADAAKAQEIASALVQQGADVLNGATNGGTMPDIAKRAQQEGVLFVGSNLDVAKYAPKAVVTSAVLDFTRGYREVADQRLAGKFVSKIRRLGIKEGFLKLLPFRLGHSAEERKTRALISRLLSGKISLAACQKLK